MACVSLARSHVVAVPNRSKGVVPPLTIFINIKQPIMRIEDRLFDRGWVRSAMATRNCGNIYFRKYFMAVRKLTNILYFC